MDKFRNLINEKLGKICDRKYLLLFGFLVTLFVVIYSILTYGRVVINSDTATLSTYVNCINKEKSIFPISWNSANGEIWTLNMLPLTMGQILFGFIKSEALRRMMASVFQLVLIIVSIVWFSKKYLKSNAWLVLFPIGTVFLWGSDEMILYQAAYGNYFIWPCVFIFLFYIILQNNLSKKSIPYIGIYSILMMYSCMQGIRAYAELVLPLILCEIVVLCFYMNSGSLNRAYLKSKLIKIIVIIAPALVGTVVYKWLCSWHYVNAAINVSSSDMPKSLDGIMRGVSKTIRYFFENYGYIGDQSLLSINGLRSIIAIVMCLIICFIVPVLQFIRLKNENERIRFFTLFVYSHNAIILLYIILSKHTMIYHILSSMILIAIVSSRYIYEYWIKSSELNRSLFWVIMFFVATLICSFGMQQQSIGWRAKLKTREKIVDELLEHDLHKGYATFWNAYGNEIYSDKEIKFCGVNIDRERLLVCSWLVDQDRYSIDNEKTFIMLTDEEMEHINDRIIYGYEVPIDEFVIEDVVTIQSTKKINDVKKTNMHVFVYNGDYGKHIVNFFADGMLDAREMSFNFIGVRDDQIITMNPNGIVYGPYAPLDPGDYDITIKGSNLDNCTIDIYSQNTPDFVNYSVKSIGDRECRCKLHIKKRVDDIQFYIENSCIKNSDNVEFWKIELE